MPTENLQRPSYRQILKWTIFRARACAVDRRSPKDIMTSRRSPWHDRFYVAFFHDLPKRCDQTAISFDGNDAPASSSGDGGRGIHGPSRLQSAGVASSPAAQEQIDLPATEGFDDRRQNILRMSLGTTKNRTVEMKKAPIETRLCSPFPNF